MNNDFDKQQFDKIANLETDVAVIKEGIKNISSAIKRLEKKTDENCKMLREDSDRYRVDVEERIKTIEDRLETKTTEFEKFMSKINVRLATWSGGLAVVLYILDKLLGLTDKIFK